MLSSLLLVNGCTTIITSEKDTHRIRVSTPAASATEKESQETEEKEKVSKENLTDPTSQEMKLFEMVNQIRKEKGLSPLQFETTAYQAAQLHSKNMAEKDFFSHTAPDGQTVGQRLVKFGFSRANRTWGENIAWNFNYPAPLDKTLEGWLNSPKHYENIINPRYEYGAIAISKNKKGHLYYTQVFWGNI
ncbi:MAG: CAP domain-containing protein [Vulcanimicrobiota bacterium]